MVAAVRALPEGAYVFSVLAIGVADLAASHAAVDGVRLAHFEPRAFEEEAVAYGSVVSHHTASFPVRAMAMSLMMRRR